MARVRGGLSFNSGGQRGVDDDDFITRTDSDILRQTRKKHL